MYCIRYNSYCICQQFPSLQVCTAPFTCKVTFSQDSKPPETIGVAHGSKAHCTESKTRLQAGSAEVSVTEDGCLLAVAYKEVAQLGISQWKFPANISHNQHWNAEPHFIILLTLLPNNIKIAFTVTKELREESTLEDVTYKVIQI